MTSPVPPLVEALDAACAVAVEALGRQSLYAALAFALALPAARLLRRSPGRLQAALWTLVLLRLVLPPDLAAPWSARSLLSEVPVGIGQDSAGAAWAPVLGATAPDGQRASSARGAAPPRFPWALLLACGWLGGVSTTAVLFARRRRRFVGFLRQAAPVREPEVLARLEALRRRTGVSRAVRLRAGPGGPPFTVGVFRPVVHLPAAVLDPEHRAAFDAALAHELAHVRARDDLRLRARAVIQALFFFHPVAWWAAARHADARELAADERVLASGSLSPRAYGRGFAAAVRLGSLDPRPAGALAAPALGANPRRLVLRLERILDPHAAGTRRHRLILPALLATGLLVLPMAGAAPAASSEAAPRAESTAPAAFSHPVPTARLTSSFGERWNPITKSCGHHHGVDLAAPTGTPVLAPAAGTVRVATELYAPAEHLGLVVVLDHDGGLETLFSHLDSLAVAAGQQVSAGQTLGTVGVSGDVTGPHLHLEVRDRGETVDPARFLDLPKLLGGNC